MNETIKNWFKSLYENEIKQSKITIANERMWLNGSIGDDESTFCHNQNIEDNEEYIRILNKKIEELG